MVEQGLFTTNPYEFNDEEPEEYVSEYSLVRGIFGRERKHKTVLKNPDYLDYLNKKREIQTSSYKYKASWFKELSDSQVEDICSYLSDSSGKLMKMQEVLGKPKTYGNKIAKICEVINEIVANENRHIYFNSRSVITDDDSRSVYSLLNYDYPQRYNVIVRDDDYDWIRVLSYFEKVVVTLKESLSLAYYSVSSSEVNVRDKKILNHISQRNIEELESIENVNILTTSAVNNLVFMCSEIYERLSSDERAKVESIIEKHVPKMVALLKDAGKMKDSGFLNEAEESVIRQIDLMNKYILSIDEQGVRGYQARMNQMELSVEEEFGVNE